MKVILVDYFVFFSFSLDWHPNNMLIAAGSSDFRARYGRHAVILLKIFLWSFKKNLYSIYFVGIMVQ